jgi:diguanylate cyclase (GGDEF)-like protein
VAFLSRIFRPEIRNAADVRAYAVTVTIFALVVTLAFDVPNHLVFFVDWSDCWRQLCVDGLTVAIVAAPLARSIGMSHLSLNLAKREAELVSRTDPLTGLANRRAFFEAVGRLRGGALALVIADIDRFKRINDDYGHAAGDEVIRTVARLMQEELGGLGTVARVGGEEFAFVSADLDAAELRERLAPFRQRVAEEVVVVGGKRIHATISAGVASRAGADFDDLYAAADRALYVAKSAGRDRIVDFAEIEDVAPEGLLRAG